MEADVRVATYLRVSTEKQADEDRYGIARQRNDVAGFVKQGEHEVVIEYVEVTSGVNGIERREAFPEMLARLEAGDFDGVVLPDLTRLSRKLTTQEALLAAVWARGGRVFTSDGYEVPQDDPDDPMRTAMRQMAGVFAQLDRAMIAKRLRDGRKAKARATTQYAWTFAPYGYKKEGARLVPDEASPAWEAITYMQIRRGKGDSLRAIASALQERGLPTPSGKEGARWTAAQVGRILKREGVG